MLISSVQIAPLCKSLYILYSVLGLMENGLLVGFWPKVVQCDFIVLRTVPPGMGSGQISKPNPHIPQLRVGVEQFRVPEHIRQRRFAALHPFGQAGRLIAPGFIQGGKLHPFGVRQSILASERG